MKADHLEIGMCGTFDVENYGDLLFPLIAQAELSRRLGSVTLHIFSYSAKSDVKWPFAVRSLTELPRSAGELDGMLIGGGQIVRFDKDVAPGYRPSSPDIHHPTGYWLAPALMSVQSGVPVAWNAPGASPPFPSWAAPLLNAMLQSSAYVSVRDPLSREVLLPYAGDTAIEVVPDSAFGISRVLEAPHGSERFAKLREVLDLKGPYIVVHATRSSADFLDWVRRHTQYFEGYRWVALPVGPINRDSAAGLFDGIPNTAKLPSWPHPLAIAELIGAASAVVGVSLHLSITALAQGVPAFRPQDSLKGKYAVLSDFDTVFSLPTGQEIDIAWFLSRLGKKAPSPVIAAATDRLARHWDRIAAHITEGRGARTPRRPLNELNELYEALRAIFDNRAAGFETQIAELTRQLADSHHEISIRNEEIRNLQHSSWRVTERGRCLLRTLRRLRTAKRH